MRFEKPVRVAVTPARNVGKVVDTPEQAAEVLLYKWHAPSGRKHLRARKAVLAAMESAQDRVKAEAARKAFVAAAEDAGLLMADMARPEPIPGFNSPSWRKYRKR
jgi:hypothetical protein